MITFHHIDLKISLPHYFYITKKTEAVKTSF